MSNRDNLLAVLNFEKPERMPMIEWASFWDKTVDNWRKANPNCPFNSKELFRFFGLDCHEQFWISPRSPKCPAAKSYGSPIITTKKEYNEIKKHLYPEKVLKDLENCLKSIKEAHTRGETAIWYTLEGFFWFPRTLLGIENHLYSFYDEPDLLIEINSDLTAFHKRTLETIYSILSPDFMTFAEDMSYNNGPMLSKELYDEFIKPFYDKIVPLIKRHGTKVFIDTDGQVEPLISWFLSCGIEGCLPLERMAGVDVNRIRKNYPRWLMIGGYDKTVMSKGKKAIKKEFLRLLPAIESGGFIPAVDHQTPPDVSEEDYRTFLRLFKEMTAI